MGLGETEPGQLAQVTLQVCSHKLVVAASVAHRLAQRLSELGPSPWRKPCLFPATVASLLLAQRPCGYHFVLAWVLFWPYELPLYLFLCFFQDMVRVTSR